MDSKFENSTAWEDARRDVVAIRWKFRLMEKKLATHRNIRYAHKLANLAVHTNSSIYYSEILENFFLDLAQRAMEPLRPRSFEKGSVLHVMTKALLNGGHTRVVERWILSAPKNEKHSVVLIRQDDASDIPPLLKSVITAKAGKLILLDTSAPIEGKANELRQLGMEYDRIVLHHHMQDPVPLMAFGIPEFTRPVIVLNHAGHMFWLGRKAADLVIDLAEAQQFITHEKRGIKNSILACLPQDTFHGHEKIPKSQLRQELGLPDEASILISMASAYKFSVVLNYDYPRMLAEILKETANAVVVIIGVQPAETEHWQALEMAFPGRVFLKGMLPHESVGRYLQAADLYLDSYPYNSFTSLVDAVSIGRLPVLSLETPIGTLPIIAGTKAVVASIADMRRQSAELLANSALRVDLYNELENRIAEKSSLESFQQVIQHVYKVVSDIKKDSCRYMPIKDYIADFDIFSNALCKCTTQTTVPKRIISIGNNAIVEKCKNPYHYAILVLGYPAYRTTLVAGCWKAFLFGISIRCAYHERS